MREKDITLGASAGAARPIAAQSGIRVALTRADDRILTLADAGNRPAAGS